MRELVLQGLSVGNINRSAIFWISILAGIWVKVLSKKSPKSWRRFSHHSSSCPIRNQESCLCIFWSLVKLSSWAVSRNTYLAPPAASGVHPGNSHRKYDHTIISEWWSSEQLLLLCIYDNLFKKKCTSGCSFMRAF